MSIFKESFTKEIRGSLKARQDAIQKRNADSIVYLNTRTAWIKMSSSVNVYSKTALPNPTQDDLLNEKNYDDSLARQYVLKGGVLNNGKLKSGVGGWNNAYSNVSQEGSAYQRGIRPMPGINSIDIKSKSAYGSLREIVVNFQCWDIKQLEDLELLYMRPGYTALIEWGWTPYLNNTGGLESTISTYDFFSKTRPKEDIWKDLFIKSNDSGGNYDAMFGFVKNFGWSARADGGYDCSTTLISIGEIIESLKINYTPALQNLILNSKGLLVPQLIIDEVVANAYKKNKLAGIFAELYKHIASVDTPSNLLINSLIIPTIPGFFGSIGNVVSNYISPSSTSNKSGGEAKTLPITKDNKKFNLDFFVRDVTIENSPTTDNDKDALVGIGADKTQVYINLESLTTLLNEFVILSDGTNNTPLIKLSTKERIYDKPSGSIPSDLLCLSHPLQLSIDPTICYIKNQNWGGLQNNTGILDNNIEISNKSQEFLRIPIITNAPNYNKLLDDIEKQVDLDRTSGLRTFFNNIFGDGKTSINDEENKIKEILTSIKEQNNPDYWRELNRQCLIRKQKTLYELLNTSYYIGLDDDQITSLVGPNYSSLIDVDIAAEFAETLKPQIEKRKEASTKVEYLKNPNVKPFFYGGNGGNPDSGMGVIGNIYVNLQFLYSLVLSNSLENTDKKEKQEINLYDFIKSILSQISNSTGNINNFDLHIDPIDNNIGRIIDINYVDASIRDEAYEDAFELELHSLKSTVRSYSLESKIYPEQSTIVAIGAQVKGGALGTNTNTLVDFNRGIIDRIIPRKEEANNTQENQASLITEQLTNLNISITTVYDFLADTEGFFFLDPSYDVQSTGKYAGALRDLIDYERSFFDDESQDSKNRSIIPTKLSFEMDGIGGLVIGHIFKIPEYLLPKGYKGGINGIDRKLGYTITGIGHKIGENHDWTTNIDSQFIILNDPQKTGASSKSANTQGNISRNIIQGNPINITYPKNSGIGSVAEDSIKYPVLVKTEAYKSQYNTTVQKSAKVNPNTPVANSVRNQLNKNYITTTENQLSGNGDITSELGHALIVFQKLIISNPSGFSFINSKKPIRITAGNDNFHRTYDDKRNRTTHCRGLAIDIGTREFTTTQTNSIISALKESGFTYVIYHAIKSGAYHIHANIKTT